MEKVSISVGSGKIESGALGYKKIIGFYLSCTVHRDCQINLDFTQLSHIDGNMCAMIMAVIHKLNKENNLTFYIDKRNYTHIKSKMDLLFSNGFLTDYVKTPYDASAVVLTAFATSDDEKFLQYIQNDLLGHERLKIGDEVKSNMEHNFLEVFSNVELHAQTVDPIFACGQYFPGKKTLHFTLVDLGKGYLPEIESFTKGAITNALEAIKWALRDNNTTKPDAPGGTGLKNLLAFCNGTNGQLAIMTGDSYWSNHGESVNMPIFCGTTIQLIFNCKN